LFKSPLFRRVGIYLVLSTAAVTVVNQLEIEQQSAYQIYIPMFIGIYVISRWLDSRFKQASQQQQANAKHETTPPSTTDRGFGQ
jgi:HJR/Mrr/RecB family endonuclease